MASHAGSTPGLVQRVRHGLRRRWLGWWMQRLRQSDEQLLTHRNVYILPTAAGWMLALTLLLLLVASINFQLNLGYLLTFMLAGSAVASMHLAHANLRDMTIFSIANFLQPARADAGFSLVLRANRRARHALRVRVLDAQASVHETPAFACTAGNTHQVALQLPSPRRGRVSLPPVRLESVYPLGLFRVWAYHRPAAEVLLYPDPEQPSPPLPRGSAHTDEDAAPSQVLLEDGADLDGLRAYRPGDAMSRVVWKKAATAWATGQGELLTRHAVPTGALQLWLSESLAGLASLEARLSRLSAWVLAADQARLRYGLLTAQACLEPGTGEAHRDACLRALALA